MAKIDVMLRRQLEGEPEASVRLIVRLTDPPQDVAEQVASRGLKVRRQYRLMPAMAIAGRAKACLALLEEPWVASVEADREVHTMG